MAFDRDQTRKFIDFRDRDIAPFFAGRAAEIRHFESSFNTLAWENKRTAAIRIFQGAPGCGKTSLVDHLRQRYSDETLFVDIRQGHLVSEEALVDEIRRTAISVASATGRTIAAFGQAVGAYLRVARPGGDEARNFVADQATRNAKVVVFFDEAQLVGEDQQPGLGLLHTSGLGFPTVVVFAGLSHTSGRLRSIGGLSRLPDNAIINMGAMDESECARNPPPGLAPSTLTRAPSSRLISHVLGTHGPARARYRLVTAGDFMELVAPVAVESPDNYLLLTVAKAPASAATARIGTLPGPDSVGWGATTLVALAGCGVRRPSHPPGAGRCTGVERGAPRPAAISHQP